MIISGTINIYGLQKPCGKTELLQTIVTITEVSFPFITKTYEILIFKMKKKQPLIRFKLVKIFQFSFLITHSIKIALL